MGWKLSLSSTSSFFPPSPFVFVYTHFYSQGELSRLAEIENSLAIFCMATYGEGDPTDNAQDFYDWLQEGDADLHGVKYTVSSSSHQFQDFRNKNSWLPPVRFSLLVVCSELFSLNSCQSTLIYTSFLDFNKQLQKHCVSNTLGTFQKMLIWTNRTHDTVQQSRSDSGEYDVSYFHKPMSQTAYFMNTTQKLCKVQWLNIITGLKKPWEKIFAHIFSRSTNYKYDCVTSA